MRAQPRGLRNILFAAGCIALAAGLGLRAWAASSLPSGLAYSGTLKNNGVADNSSHAFVFELVSAGASLSPACTDMRTLTSSNGRFNAAGLFAGCSLASILANQASLAIRITVDGQVLTPDQALGTVPFAARASVADSASSVAGTVNQLAKFTGAGAVGSSLLYEGTDGNIGIGTTNPNITGASGNFRFLTMTAPVGGYVQLGSAGTLSGSNSDIGGLSFFDGATEITEINTENVGTDAGFLRFKTRPPAGTLTERMRIDQNGNVGIGTAGPVGSLEVQGGSGVSTVTRIVSNNDVPAFATMVRGSSGHTLISMSYAASLADAGVISIANGTTSRITLDAGSSSIIGGATSGGQEQLCVPGTGTGCFGGAESLNVSTALFNGSYYGVIIGNTRPGGQNGDYYMRFCDAKGCNGSIGASGTSAIAYNTTSDGRLKERVVEMTDGLETVRKMRPVTFHWKHDGSADRGFIAQELRKAYPTAVSGDPSGDPSRTPMQVDYGKLTPVLTAALKELASEVDLLKAENAALRSRLERLEERR